MGEIESKFISGINTLCVCSQDYSSLLELEKYIQSKGFHNQIDGSRVYIKNLHHFKYTISFNVMYEGGVYQKYLYDESSCISFCEELKEFVDNLSILEDYFKVNLDYRTYGCSYSQVSLNPLEVSRYEKMGLNIYYKSMGECDNYLKGCYRALLEDKQKEKQEIERVIERLEGMLES